MAAVRYYVSFNSVLRNLVLRLGWADIYDFANEEVSIPFYGIWF